MKEENIIIIGAGPAGLTAGYQLLEKGYKVTILEESNNIGGISQTIKYNKHYMDIGGHRFFSKDKKVMDFWKKIMPMQGKPSFDDKKLGRKVVLEENGPDPDQEDEVMLIRRRVSRIYYNKKFFDYPITIKWETFKNMGLWTSIVAGFSYMKSAIFKRTEKSLEDFYINRFGKKLYTMFFEGYTEKLWGRHPSQISADWGSQRVKGVSITAIIKDIFGKILKGKNRKVETSLIEEFYYPKYGPGQLWEKVASEIEKMNGTIIKNAKVVKLNNDKNKVNEITYVKDGKEETLSSDVVISSMPLKDLVVSLTDTSEEQKDIAQGLPYRDFITMGILVNKLKLENKTKMSTLSNIVPDCWIYVQDCSVKLGRIQIFNNWSPYLVNKPEDTVWLGMEYFCNENDEFWNMEDKQAIDFGIDELIKIGVIDNKEEILDTHRAKIKKAYPAYFDTYKDIDKLIEFINKYDNLYCVGRNGQHRYNNMDHSMVTAFETVNNIVNNKKDKSNVWSVNTDKEYHEEEKGKEKND